jgi:signal transduction histidine kinase
LTERFNSIALQLIAVILAVALPFGGLIGYLIYQAATEARHAALGRLTEATRDLGNEVRGLYRQTDWLLSQLAGRPGARALDPAFCSSELTALRGARQEFRNLVLFRSDGSVACSGLTLHPAGARYRYMTATEGLSMPGTHAGDVVWGPISEQLVVVFTHPIKAATGETVGLVAVTVGLRYFDDLLAQLNLGPGYVVAVADRTGHFIARAPDGDRFRGKRLPPSAIGMEGDGHMRTEGADGVVRRYMHARSSETGWVVFAGIEEDRLFASYRSWILQSAVVTALVLLLSGVLAFLLIHRIRHPLRALSAAAQAVAAGDTTRRANVRQKGEIARAAAQFDRMLDSLAASETSLREANRRLKALSARLLRSAEDERGHIARELHDQVGQALTVLELDLGYMSRQPGSDKDRIGRCRELIGQLIEQVRNLSLDLRPSQLDDLGLAAALQGHLERHFTGRGVQVHLDAQVCEARLTPDLETACFRICQEALTNVLRHAQAANVWIELRDTPQELVLKVRDDGVGFDPDAALASAATGRSSGLRNMLDRTTLAGGKLVYRSVPGESEIVATLPVA